MSDRATALDSDHARQLAAAQLIPILITVLLHAKDIGEKPVLDVGLHEIVEDIMRLCVHLNARWSSDDRRRAIDTAERLLKALLQPKPLTVTGLHGKVIGGRFPKGTTIQ